ncbi:Protein 21.1 [Giardia lamblia P15]|uniref:Protein 21.1 n=1 Tax=Giardia intestinalis (strain P15) TaxID=658858 RepID=E1EYI7_GIAIA|nr:Protein 21.1 [Giardia lamblia P15]
MQIHSDHSVTSLMQAAINGNPEVLKQHLDQLRMVDVNGKTALMYAAEHGNDDCIPLLMDEAGIQEKEKGQTALILSVLALRIPPLPLVQAEATIQDFTGMTASGYAIARGNYSAVVIIDGHTKRNSKLTPLMCAARVGDVYSVEKLMDKYAHQKDTWGRTALIHAALCNSPIGNNCIRVLRHKEAGVQDVYGRTALMYAAINCNLEGIKLLLETPSEAGAMDKEGKCALSYAIENKSYDSICALASTECRVTPSLFAMYQNMKEDLIFKVFTEGTSLQTIGENCVKRAGLNPQVCVLCKSKMAVIAPTPCNHVCICVDCCRHCYDSNANACPTCDQGSCGWKLISE